MGPTRIMETTTKPETRPRRGSLPELRSVDKSADKGVDKKAPTGPRANPLYKTRLCMNYQSTGSCPYTEKCQFAHGVAELEKWETWRVGHKPEDRREDSSPLLGSSHLEHEGRVRSQSYEARSRSQSNESHEFLSPFSLNWDLRTPAKSGNQDENTPISSASTNFSLWSSLMDDIENNSYSFSNSRSSRSSTVDSTYDNMSQLRDAPTLFSSPPVLPNFSKMKFSH